MWRIALILLACCLGATAADITSFLVTPAAMNFAAIDPDTGGPAAQSSTVSIRFTGSFFGAWTLSVQSEGPVLINCGTIPASAVAVRCVSATIDGWFGGASCNGSPIPVSTSPAILATGGEGIFSSNITVNLQVSFADSWRYRAALAPACTVSLRYTADLP